MEPQHKDFLCGHGGGGCLIKYKCDLFLTVSISDCCALEILVALHSENVFSCTFSCMFGPHCAEFDTGVESFNLILWCFYTSIICDITASLEPILVHYAIYTNVES